MPVTVVVGGQFGSEGKGKVAHALAVELNASIAIRVGGPNSGHTVVAKDGRPLVFRQLPTAAIEPGVQLVLPAGTYIEEDLLHAEVARADVRPSRLSIDPYSVIVTDEDRKAEGLSGLSRSIGSTASGTGNAVLRRIQRRPDIKFAKDVPELRPYVRDTMSYVDEGLRRNERVILEGTQGFGLSLLHSGNYPFVTSRDTTASGFISEAGISPLSVDQIVLVIRAFPIRVAGNSGPLSQEIDWQTITRESGRESLIQEYTSVTNKLRRVARFDADVVKRAITANNPTRIVMNHVDYVDSTCIAISALTPTAHSFVRNVERSIGRDIDDIGLGPRLLIRRAKSLRRVGEKDG